VKFVGLDQSEIKKKLSKRLKKSKADHAILNSESYSDKLYLIPYYSLNSKIIEFKQWAKLWSSLPTYVGIRQPHLVYSTAQDGYNLTTMYTFCRNFIDEQEEGGEELKDYFYTLLIIQTGKEEVFGAFVSAFPFNGIKD
jgi:hypothetical protein